MAAPVDRVDVRAGPHLHCSGGGAPCAVAPHGFGLEPEPDLGPDELGDAGERAPELNLLAVEARQQALGCEQAGACTQDAEQHAGGHQQRNADAQPGRPRKRPGAADGREQQQKCRRRRLPDRAGEEAENDAEGEPRQRHRRGHFPTVISGRSRS